MKKVSLVVASGAQQGRVIPLPGPQFVIGRDQECDLRAASPAVSRRHCVVTVRNGRVYLRDLATTNGTFVNDVLIQGAEVRVEDGMSLRVGPLHFRVRIEAFVPQSNDTPLPTGQLALKPTGATATKAPAHNPLPHRTVGTGPPSGTRPQPTGPATQAFKPKPVGPTSAPAPKSGNYPSRSSTEFTTEDDHNLLAATLRGLDEAGNTSVPEGSTVMDLPVPVPVPKPPAAATAAPPGDSAAAGVAAGEKKKDEKAKPAQTREDMTNIAGNLLRKYMRRRN
jgi:pSer/pThr/pTyr-binding forkhead associated (FHA) protein